MAASTQSIALDEYTSATSLSRVLLVCIGAPIPTVVLVLIQENVPLQDPAAGWRENYGFWVRAGIVTFVITFLVSDQSRFLIDGVVISRFRQFLLSVCIQYVRRLFSCHIISLDVSRSVLRDNNGSGILPAAGYIVSSRRRRSCISPNLAAMGSICTIYPAYESLFRYAEGSRYQIIAIVLLPILKVALKSIVLRCMAHMEDLVPEAVIFTVDFFNAIYIATCMQSATSAFAVTAITITDLSQTAIMLYGLHKRTLTIMSRLRLVVGNTQENDNLVETLCLLCRDPEKFNAQVRADVRVTSCFPHALSDEDKMLLDKLAGQIPTEAAPTACLDSSITMTAKPSTFRGLKVCCAKNWIGIKHPIVPAPVAPAQLTKLLPDSHRIHSLTRRSTILQESLEVLFSMECLVATAYLEAAIPFFYGCYIVIMVFLPSARYHSEMIGITSENMGFKVQFLLLFGLLQVFSFVVLVILIKRNCGVRAWYHLAFVLDTQMSLVQGKLIVWVVVTMCFRVVHFGTSVVDLLLQVLIASVVNTFFDGRCRLHIPLSPLRASPAVGLKHGYILKVTLLRLGRGLRLPTAGPIAGFNFTRTYRLAFES